MVSDTNIALSLVSALAASKEPNTSCSAAMLPARCLQQQHVSVSDLLDRQMDWLGLVLEPAVACVQV
jgi:hypothetical protein